MATTSFFEENIKDPAKQNGEIHFEIGRSSYTGDNLIYLSVDDKKITLNEETGKKLVEAVERLGRYLDY